MNSCIDAESGVETGLRWEVVSQRVQGTVRDGLQRGAGSLAFGPGSRGQGARRRGLRGRRDGLLCTNDLRCYWEGFWGEGG